MTEILGLALALAIVWCVLIWTLANVAVGLPLPRPWREIAKGLMTTLRALDEIGRALETPMAKVLGVYIPAKPKACVVSGYLAAAYAAFSRDYEADETLDKREAVAKLETAVECVETGGKLDAAGRPVTKEDAWRGGGMQVMMPMPGAVIAHPLAAPLPPVPRRR